MRRAAYFWLVMAILMIPFNGHLAIGLGAVAFSCYMVSRP